MSRKSPIRVKVIDHVVIRSALPDSLIAFYCDILGCTMERDVSRLGLYQLRAGTSLIDIVDTAGELGKAGGSAPGADARNMDHLCLRIDPWDETAIHAFLQENAVSASETGERYGAEGDGPSIYIQDPDGNTVELKGPPSV